MSSPENPLYYAALWPQQVSSSSNLPWAAPTTASLPVAVCTINYQAAELTEGCLTALAKLQVPPAWVVVVDNGPGIADFERLSALATQSSWPFQLLILRAPFNGGYSAANNLAMRYACHQAAAQGVAPPEVFWHLNNDTQPTSTALEELWEAYQQAPKALYGSCLRNLDGSYQMVGNRIRRDTGSIRGYPEPTTDQPFPVDSLCGASALVPYQALLDVGLMDVPYFLYWEDTAYSCRAADAGYPSVCIPTSVVLHHGSGTTNRQPNRRDFYYHRNRLFFAAQCFTPWQFITTMVYVSWRWFKEVLAVLAAYTIGRCDPAYKWQALSIYTQAVRAVFQKTWGACPTGIQ